MLIFYLVSVCGMAVLDVPFYFETGKRGKHPNRILHMILKVLPTAAAAFFSLYCCLHISAERWRVWLTVGLFLGTVADGLLEISLYPGGIAFGLGHIAYLISFMQLHVLIAWSLVIFIPLCLIALVFAMRMRKRLPKGIMLLLGGLYALILLSMVSAAIPLLWTSPGLRSVILVAGCLLFAVSDLLLLRNSIRELPVYPNRYVSLSVYYLAQLTIALSAAFIA